MVKRVAIINAWMDEGSSYCGSSGEIECVGCGEYREYGNDRRWRGMKSVWRNTVWSQIWNQDFDRQAGSYGFGGREGERGVDYFRGLLRETDENKLSFREIESEIVRRHSRSDESDSGLKVVYGRREIVRNKRIHRVATQMNPTITTELLQ